MAGIKVYMKETYVELTERVTWPTWKELQSSSVLVFIASLMISLIIFAMDYLFGVQNAGDDGSNGFVWRGLLGFIYSFFG